MNGALRRLREDERGFSLVELMVVILISSVIMGFAANSVITSLQVQRRQMAQVEALNAAKLSLERMTRDVRAANPVVVAQGDALEVTVERAGGTETSTFRLEPAVGGVRRLVWCQTTLAACTGAAVRPMLDDVSTSAGYALLRYYDETGVEIAAPVGAAQLASVRTVDIALRVEIPEVGPPLLLDNEIVLRNWSQQ